MKCDCGAEAAFVHSACCGAHWELRVDNDKCWLECEECGKSGPEVVLK